MFSLLVDTDGAPADPSLTPRLLAPWMDREVEGSTAPSRVVASEGSALALAATRWHHRARVLRGRSHSGDVLLLAGDAVLHERDPLIRSLGLAPDADLGDLELILAGHQAWGLELPGRLVGEFAYALWDPSADRLVAVRDPLGLRPLFWTRRPGLFGVASSAQLLARHPRVGERISPPAVMGWMTARFDDFASLFEGIEAVNPGEIVTWEAGALDRRTYWSPYRGHRIRPRPPEQARSELRELLRTVVADRAPPDGRGACDLSGGMDSPTVASFLAERAAPGRRPTFLSYCWDTLAGDPDCDETDLVKETAARLDGELAWIPAEDHPTPASALALGDGPDLPRFGSEALHRSIHRRCLSRGLRVRLTGQGGDSLFSGPGPAAFGLAARVKRWLRHASPARARPRVAGLGRGPGPRPLWLDRGAYADAGIEELRRRDATLGAHLDPARELVAASLGSRYRALRLSMRYGAALAWETGIEERHPLMDVRLADFVLDLPPGLLRPGGVAKGLLRDTMRGALPARVVDRREKPLLLPFHTLGFSQVRPRVEALFQSSRLADLGLVDPAALVPALDAFEASGGRGPAGQLWHTIVMESWLRRQA